MMSNAISCSAWQLYVIVDPSAAGGRDLVWVAEQAIRGGADAIQLREKHASATHLLDDARRVLQVTKARGVPLIINDRADVALAAGADGVHLGQDDVPVEAARRILGPHALIGRSTHSVSQALTADAEPLDYVALGPLYPTPTKPDAPHIGLEAIGQVRQKLRHPLVVIGGIDAARIPDVRNAGARCIVVVRAVCAAPDPCSAARILKQLLL